MLGIKLGRGPDKVRNSECGVGALLKRNFAVRRVAAKHLPSILRLTNRTMLTYRSMYILQFQLESKHS